MMVEYGEAFWGPRWALAVRCPRRQSPRRHAVAALRHLRHGRPPARRDGRGGGRGRLDVRRDARRRARLPGRALRRRPRGRPRAGRGRARRAPRSSRRRSRACVGRRPDARGAGARDEATRPRRSSATPGPARGRRPRRRGRPALQFTRRNLLVLAAFLLAALAALYFLLPQLAGLDDTWRRIEDGRPAWLGAAFLFTCGMFAGYVALFRGIYAGVTDRDATGGRATRSPWRAWPRRGCSRPAARAGWCSRRGPCAARAWPSGPWPTRRWPSSSCTYFPYVVAVVVCGFGLHWGLFAGTDPFAFTFVPAVIGLIAMLVCLALAVRADRPRAPARAVRRRARAASGGSPSSSPRRPPRCRRACARRSAT